MRRRRKYTRAYRGRRTYKQQGAASRVSLAIDRADRGMKQAVAQLKGARQVAQRMEGGGGVVRSLDSAISRVGSAWVELQEALSQLDDIRG